MASSLETLDNRGPGAICAFHFLKRSPTYDEVKPYYFSGALEDMQEQARSNLEYDIQDGIQLTDLRGLEHKLSLGRHGFQLLRHEPVIDLNDPSEEDMNRYLEDVVDMVKKHLGAEAAFAYNFRVSSS
jgi:hypothetical protein